MSKKTKKKTEQTELALATKEPPADLALSEPLPQIAIDTAAIMDAVKDPNVDAEKAERLFALVKDIQEKEEAKHFAAAMHRVQLAMIPIKKTAHNDHTGSTYARLEAIDKMLTPLYLAEDLAVSMGTKDSPVEGMLRVTLTVRHKAGHTEDYFLDAPIDNKGTKGNPTKTALHGMGSTITYC